MTLAEAILTAMMTLACPTDEPAEQCLPWRSQVSEAIAQAAEEATCSSEASTPACRPIWRGPADTLAADLVEIGYHESGLRRRIQEGKCRDDECDAVRIRGGHWHRARSMWQIHSTPEIPGVEALVPRSRWLAIQGADPSSVLLAARTAARVLVSSPSAFGRAAKAGKRAGESARLLARIRTARAEASAHAREPR